MFIWKAHIAKFIRISRRTRKEFKNCSNSFPFPAAFRATSRRKRPVRFNEGGELGYSLVHAYGAVFDNPDLIAACVIGDGEAETGALAASWHSNKFINPARDGIVLPILHLNGYKIANPTVLARLSREELESLMIGYGHKPYFVEGDDPEVMHEKMAETLDAVYAEIAEIKRQARENDSFERPIYPMIVLRTSERLDGTENG